MDILTHSLSGAAFGTVLSSYSGSGGKSRISIIMISGFGAAIPDIDAITLWSKFDSTIGNFFSLSHKGNEIYFAKFWYSHHGFFHSLLAGVLITLFFYSLIFFAKKQKAFSLSLMLLTAGFLGGFWIHLFEDIPTPGSVWGGVNLFWPSKFYVGGTGYIWWWNNYDLFLIILSIVSINLLIFAIERLIIIKSYKLTTLAFILGMALFIIQIKTRETDFNYKGFTSGYNELESKSKKIQKKILGNKVYNTMLGFDNLLPLNF